jgi:hypothetical protein
MKNKKQNKQFWSAFGNLRINPKYIIQPSHAYSQASNMVGMGLTPEAIETYLPPFTK